MLQMINLAHWDVYSQLSLVGVLEVNFGNSVINVSKLVQMNHTIRNFWVQFRLLSDSKGGTGLPIS